MVPLVPFSYLPCKSDAHGIVSDLSEQQAGQALSSQWSSLRGFLFLSKDSGAV